MDQIEVAYSTLLARPTEFWKDKGAIGLDGQAHPRIVSLGGDHTIVRRNLFYARERVLTLRARPGLAHPPLPKLDLRPSLRYPLRLPLGLVGTLQIPRCRKWINFADQPWDVFLGSSARGADSRELEYPCRHKVQISRDGRYTA